MEVKEAVRLARDHIMELFAPEGISSVRLEEVVFDDEDDIWKITIGFMRPEDSTKSSLVNPLSDMFNLRERVYKSVHIRDSNGHVIAVLNRSIPDFT